MSSHRIVEGSKEKLVIQSSLSGIRGIRSERVFLIARIILLFFFYGRGLSLFIYFSRYRDCNISAGVYNNESEILNAFEVKSCISVIVPKSIRLNNTFRGLRWCQ